MTDPADIEARLRETVTARYAASRDLLLAAADALRDLRADFALYAQHGPCQSRAVDGLPCSCGLDAARARHGVKR